MPKRDAGFLVFPSAYRMQNIYYCSLAAQGLWLRMQMRMAQAARFGYLELNGKSVPDNYIARWLGVGHDEYLQLLLELEEANCIFRERRTKIIYWASAPIIGGMKIRV